MANNDNSSSGGGGWVALLLLLVLVLVGGYVWACQCKVIETDDGMKCGRGGKACKLMSLMSECKSEECKFGTCAAPSCSEKKTSDECGLPCVWNSGNARVPASCTGDGTDDNKCSDKKSSKECTDPCKWNEAVPAVEASCSYGGATSCEKGEGCKAPCVYSSPSTEKFEGPARFTLRNEAHLRSMLRDAGWDGQGGGWCPFANGIGCG